MPKERENVSGSDGENEEDRQSPGDEVLVHWFRHGLRLHDNPALLDGLKNCSQFYPIFIFDGSVAGTEHFNFPGCGLLYKSGALHNVLCR